MMFDTPICKTVFPVKPLGDGCEFISGYAFKGKDFTDSGNPVIKIKNIQNGKVTTEESQFVSDEVVINKLDKFRLDDGDILIAMTGQGSVGRVGRLYISEDETPYLNQRVGKFSADEITLNNDFLYYVIGSKAYENYLFAAGSGSGQPNLSPTIIKSVEIPYPPYDIQCRIGKVLKDLDDKIELNTQTNQTLEHIAQAIFKSWFVDFDPVKAKMETLAAGGSADDAELAAMSVISAKTVDELNSLKASNPEAFNKLAQTATLFPAAMQDSELGEIPEGWNIKPIKGFGKVITGKTPPHKVENAYNEQGVSFITPTDIDSDIFVTETKRFLSESGVEVVKKNLLPAGSICVTCIGSQMGKTVITPSVSISNQQINSIVVAKEYQRNFLFLNLRRRREEIFLIGSSGSTMPIINKSTFEKLLVLAPTDTLFKAFDETVSSLLNKIHKNALENQTLTALRDTLLPKLLSGEIDLTSEVVE
ncbi:restriction endonuclease subunit S [Vibrio vulnificus]|uniref:restriction endonuclease subunit S n=1 Tax=Vibrio vulnificus TaxID=672 RepID=UPI00102A281D|nr:restriction endonuclease subunit S [Vibrio vulnificus]EHU9517591.1 restriction endonuclease subunit S [Vibrio vulnificus]MCU8207898.1 restriction endonuclease subunit S [Vibrio vulnificus]RZP64681.1 restriction endonuclease subunit S [Vibrio vulnificus]